MYKKIVFLIFFFFLISFCLAQKIPFNEKEAYRLLYENELKHNDAILSTIYYALGGLATAVLLVFTSNWWFNEKKVKDSIEQIDIKYKNLKDEIDLENSNIFDRIDSDLKNNILEFESTTKDLIRISEERLRKDFENLIKNFQNTLLRDVDNIKINVNQKIDSNSEHNDLQFQFLKENIKSQDDKLKNEIEKISIKNQQLINRLKSKVYRNEFYLWKTKGVYSNAITALFNELEIMSENDQTISKFYLIQILDTLKKVESLSAYDVKFFKSILNRIKLNDDDNVYLDLIFEKIDSLEKNRNIS